MRCETKAVPGGRVKTGPLYPAGEAPRLAAEAEEKCLSTENAKRLKAWEEDDSAYDPDEDDSSDDEEDDSSELP
jgi:hypothetical protein